MFVLFSAATSIFLFAEIARRVRRGLGIPRTKRKWTFATCVVGAVYLYLYLKLPSLFFVCLMSSNRQLVFQRRFSSKIGLSKIFFFTQCSLHRALSQHANEAAPLLPGGRRPRPEATRLFVPGTTGRSTTCQGCFTLATYTPIGAALCLLSIASFPSVSERPKQLAASLHVCSRQL